MRGCRTYGQFHDWHGGGCCRAHLSWWHQKVLPHCSRPWKFWGLLCWWHQCASGDHHTEPCVASIASHSIPFWRGRGRNRPTHCAMVVSIFFLVQGLVTLLGGCFLRTPRPRWSAPTWPHHVRTCVVLDLRVVIYYAKHQSGHGPKLVIDAIVTIRLRQKSRWCQFTNIGCIILNL